MNFHKRQVLCFGDGPFDILDRSATVGSPRSRPRAGRWCGCRCVCAQTRPRWSHRARPCWVPSPVTADRAPVTAVTVVTGVTAGTVVRGSEGDAGHVSRGGFGGAGARPGPVKPTTAPVTTVPITTVAVPKPKRVRARGRAGGAKRPKSHGEPDASHGGHGAGTAVTVLARRSRRRCWSGRAYTASRRRRVERERLLQHARTRLGSRHAGSRYGWFQAKRDEIARVMTERDKTV